jgi:hypothetical protein
MTLATIQEPGNGPLVQGDLVYTDGVITATVRDGARTYTGRLLSAAIIALALAGPAAAGEFADAMNNTVSGHVATSVAQLNAKDLPNRIISPVARRSLLNKAKADYQQASRMNRATYYDIVNPTQKQINAYTKRQAKLDSTYNAERARINASGTSLKFQGLGCSNVCGGATDEQLQSMGLGNGN